MSLMKNPVENHKEYVGKPKRATSTEVAPIYYMARKGYRFVAMFLLGCFTGLACVFTTTRLSSVCSKNSLNFSSADLSMLLSLIVF
jgi:hypothetical protein